MRMIMNEKDYMSWDDKDNLIEADLEKEMYKEHYKQLRNGNTNMGYDDWKLSNEVLNNDKR